MEKFLLTRLEYPLLGEKTGKIDKRNKLRKASIRKEREDNAEFCCMVYTGKGRVNGEIAVD